MNMKLYTLMGILAATSVYAGYDTAWFSASVNGSEAMLSNCAWADTAPTAEGNAWTIDKEATFNVTSSTSATDNFSCTDLSIAFGDLLDVDDLPSATPDICGIAPTEGGWKLKNGDDWEALTGEIPAVAKSPYIVRLEMNETATTPKFRLSVKGTGDSDFSVLKYDNSEWIEKNVSALSSIKFSGEFQLNSVAATVPNTENDTLVSEDDVNVAVDKAWLEEKGKEATATGSNGLKVWESYVLGLDPDSTTSKPIVKAQQSDDADTLRFALDGVTLAANSGATVNYCIKTYSSPSSATPTATSASVPAGSTVDLPLPESGDNVEYYRVAIEMR